MSNKISTQELVEKIESAKPLIINVVTEKYHQAKHIPGSVNHCIYEVAFVDKVSEAVSNKDTEIVVYGRNNDYEASARAAWMLDQAGYINVFDYQEGIEGWESTGESVEGTGQIDDSCMDGEYQFDKENSYVEWEGSNVGNRHYGHFDNFDGMAVISEGKLQSAQIEIDMKSIVCEDLKDEGANKGLINHLESSDFFEAETYPIAKLVTKEISKIDGVVDGDKNYLLKADLTIKDVTKEIEIPVYFGDYGEAYVFQGSLDFDRSEFNVKYGSGKFFEWLESHLVNNTIRLRFKLSINK
jgi:polyisoprenoid-binding protein YceI